MRIYDDAPRHDFEEVLRTLGADLDRRGMREIVILEVASGFQVHGLAVRATDRSTWADAVGHVLPSERFYSDDDIAELLEHGPRRRGAPDAVAGPYERTLRVLGRYVDGRNASSMLLVEQGAHVLLRTLRTAGVPHHEMVQFAQADLDVLVAEGPASRSVPKGRRVFGRR
jgi:hypothetical protein